MATMTLDPLDLCLQFMNLWELEAGYPFKVNKYAVHTNIYAHFFTNRSINHWNNLPCNIVSAGTLNSLKDLIDKHWWDHLLF